MTSIVTANINYYQKHPEGHMLYITEVSFRGSNWLIEKRYNDFAALHRGLSREFRDKDVGQLPPKRFFNRFEPQFLEERSQALQAFLMRVLAEIPVTSSDAMMGFLEVFKHVHINVNQPEEQEQSEEEDRRAEFEAMEERRLKRLVQEFVDRMVYSQSVKVEPRDDAEVEERRQRLLIACDGFRAHDEHLKQFFNKPPPVNNFMQSGTEAAIELETPLRLSSKAVHDLMTVNDNLFDEQKKGRPIMSTPLVTHLDTL